MKERVLLREKREAGRVVLKKERIVTEGDQPGGGQWKKYGWRCELVDLRGTAVVYLDECAIETLILAAFQNKNKKAQRGGLRAQILNVQEIEGTRRTEEKI